MCCGPIRSSSIRRPSICRNSAASPCPAVDGAAAPVHHHRPTHRGIAGQNRGARWHGIHVLYSDTASRIWRGKDYRDFSILHLGDEINVTYRIDGASRQVVIHLDANVGKVEGWITHVGGNGFQVDENYNAPPESGYRRGLRQIVYDSGTQWAKSLPEDLKSGRDVFIIGLGSAGKQSGSFS